MHVFMCPNCGYQALEQSNGSAFFRCSMCRNKWVIVHMPEDVGGLFLFDLFQKAAIKQEPPMKVSEDHNCKLREVQP
jgi:hypothetical protein